jgi:UDP-N-acetylmuramate--alanine ligase
MNYPGLINVENAVAAASLAYLAGASSDEIKAGLEEYLGVIRRFDVRFKNEKYIYIDDYAHHPEELKAVITSVKALYPNHEITGLFQPHLYSRTRDFSAEFAASLDLLDRCILLPLYPAREAPIPNVNSEIIFNQMKLGNKFLESKKDALDRLRNTNTDVIITMGAGDIDGLATEIVEILKNKN